MLQLTSAVSCERTLKTQFRACDHEMWPAGVEPNCGRKHMDRSASGGSWSTIPSWHGNAAPRKVSVVPARELYSATAHNDVVRTWSKMSRMTRAPRDVFPCSRQKIRLHMASCHCPSHQAAKMSSPETCSAERSKIRQGKERAGVRARSPSRGRCWVDDVAHPYSLHRQVSYGRALEYLAHVVQLSPLLNF